ncbi:MAG: hypothetical protein ACPGXK_01520, partial [Phycisphaerae bacterium]
ASGVEGVDWYFGPAPNEITLTHGDQDVELKVYVADWAPETIAAHDALLDCDSLFASIAGRALAIDDDCAVTNGGFNDDFCIGSNIDEVDPPYVLANAPSILVPCQSVNDCPDGLPGAYQCGGIAILGDSGPDPGEPRYMTHFSIHVPQDVQGVIPVTLEVNENATFLVNPMAERLPITGVFNAKVTVLPTGACCRNSISFCLDDSTESACTDAGGTFLVNATCDTLDSDDDGISDLCDVCPGLDDSIYAPECIAPVPTVSSWGLLILAMLLLTTAKVTQPYGKISNC